MAASTVVLDSQDSPAQPKAAAAAAEPTELNDMSDSAVTQLTPTGFYQHVIHNMLQIIKQQQSSPKEDRQRHYEPRELQRSLFEINLNPLIELSRRRGHPIAHHQHAQDSWEQINEGLDLKEDHDYFMGCYSPGENHEFYQEFCIYITDTELERWDEDAARDDVDYANIYNRYVEARNALAHARLGYGIRPIVIPHTTFVHLKKVFAMGYPRPEEEQVQPPKGRGKSKSSHGKRGKSQSSSTSMSRGFTECYVCGSPNHYATHCPQTKAASHFTPNDEFIWVRLPNS